MSQRSSPPQPDDARFARWSRRQALGPAGPRRTEVWEWSGAQQEPLSCQVDVTVGKPLDVVRLRGTSVDQTREYADFLRKTARELYAPDRPQRLVATCPCCGTETAGAEQTCVIHGVPYHRCTQCGHGFVRSQPSVEALNEIFAESDTHAAVYTDRAAIEVRLEQVVQPKLEWTRQVYYKHRGRALESVLDVGAGAGHFVESCRRAGVRVEGFEISRSAREFAKAVFGIILRETDFLEASCEEAGFDLITFWGLLEYTPEPRRFLDAARRRLSADAGMLVVEVPRFESLGSAIQAVCPAGVARHLDPTSHVNVFSDASLATVLVASGFQPVAAWYFGMDAFELLMQLALQLDEPDLVGRLAHLIPPIQASMDCAYLCDDIVVAAVPMH